MSHKTFHKLVFSNDLTEFNHVSCKTNSTDKLIHTKLLFATRGSTAEQCKQKDNHEGDYISSFYFR